MSHSINIDLLEQIGACRPHCIKLREIFPNGVVAFDAEHFPELQDKKVQVFWGTALLSREQQIALALSWYDRALTAQTPTWKTALRTLIQTPELSAAALQLSARLIERRAVAATDVAATATAGVGYAAAAFAGKFAETVPDMERLLAAVMVLAQWCAQAASVAESKTMDEVLDEFRSDVWTALEKHGPTLPA